MPKAILEFNLPEERDEFWLASNANTLYCTLHSVVYDILRPKWKYEEHSEEVQEMIDKIYGEVWETIGDLLGQVD